MIKLIFSLILIIHVLASASEKKPVYLAAIDTSANVVRPLFEKSKDDWRTIGGNRVFFEKIFQWIIAFDGKNLGKLKTLPRKEPIRHHYLKGSVIVENFKTMPKIKDKSNSFFSWNSKMENRPVVLLSQPNFLDPDQWKPFLADKKLLKLVFQSYRNKFPTIKNCVYKPKYSVVDVEYSDRDIEVHKSYRSTSSMLLIPLSSGLKYKCDGPKNGAWLKHWFLVMEQKVIYLGQGMALVDAGDYDLNGKSEVLFWINQYNKNGFKLFYSDFKKSVDFVWSYH